MNPKSLFLVLRPALLLACSALALTQTQAPAFKVDTNLQSIAVQVTDKQGTYVHGLSAPDFTLLEDGHPQKIAFFASEYENPSASRFCSIWAGSWISVAGWTARWPFSLR